MRRLVGDWRAWMLALAGPPALTALLVPVAGPLQATNVAFAYLLIVLAAAAFGGIGPGVVASVGGFLMFNVFFIEPLHSLAISARRDAVVLLGFLVTSLVVSALVATVERRRDEAEQQAADARLLYDLSVSLAHPLERGGELARVSELATSRLDLDAVAAGVRRGDAVEVACSGGRSEVEIKAALRQGGSGVVVATAQLTTGHEVFLLAYPKPDRVVDQRHRTLLNGIAAFAAGAAERGAQEQRRREVEILQETDRQRSALLSAVSHDLRTPLAAITAAAAALGIEDVPAQDRTELAHAITAEGERLASMVSNLLDLGRIDGGALVADREPVPVDELVGGVLTRVRPRLGNRRLTIDVPLDLPAVLIDHVQIDSALGNLVDNVLSHTPVAAGLGIAVAAAGGWVTIRVSDEGHGIPEAERAALFERFNRGAASHGSGLGLAIARAYAAASGGQLEHAPTPRGAAFDLHLVGVVIQP